MKAKLWVIQNLATGKFLNNSNHGWEEHEELRKARFFREKHFASSSLSNLMGRDVWKLRYKVAPVEVNLMDGQEVL